MAFKIPNFYAQHKKGAFAKGPEASTVPSPLNISYDAAYDAQSDEKKSKQSREEFKKSAKKYNKKEYGTTEPTKAAEKGEITGDKGKKLIVRKLKAKKEREDVAKAKKTSTKPAEEKKVSTSNKAKIIEKNTNKVDKIKTRGDKKVDRIKARQEKRKNRKADRAENKEARVAGRAVRKEARQDKRAKVKEAKSGSPAEMKDPKYFGLGKDDGTGRKIKKANKTLKQISKMQNKRSSIKDTYSGDPDDKMPEQVRTADKPASKRETRKIKKYKKTKEQLGDKIAKSPDMIK